MASVVHSRWNKAAGVPIFYPLVRHTGQQRGITSRPSSTHHGETEHSARRRPRTPSSSPSLHISTDFCENVLQPLGGSRVKPGP